MTRTIIFTKRLRFVLSILLVVFISIGNCKAQQVDGKVIDINSKNPIPFANLKLTGSEYQGRSLGISARQNGTFTFKPKSYPFTVDVTAVGYTTKSVTITSDPKTWLITLKPETFILDDFIVSSEKITNEELKRSIQIEKLNVVELKNTASFNFYDAVINLKGVDVATQSIIVNSVNARGFNSTTNLRFKQFTDGIDTQAPGLGFSLGNIVGPTSLDIENLELIPGPTTSKYGPGAFNGVLLMTTKNPFDYQGLSVEAKGASIALEQFDDKFFTIGDAFISDISVRYANEIVKEKLAFKVNFSRLRGQDFRAQNYRNLGPGYEWETEHYEFNQGVNGVNVYGDDRGASIIKPKSVLQVIDGLPIISERDTVFQVTRKGYQEGDLANYTAENDKFSGALHYRLNPKTEFVFESFYGKASTIISSDDRLALRGFEIHQNKLELKHDNFFVRGYSTSQNSGNTFNIGKTAESILELAKPSEEWFRQYQLLVASGREFLDAREIADSSFPFNQFLNRFEPGTEQFDSLRNVIVQSQNPAFGAAIFDRSKLYHVETGMDLKLGKGFLDNLQIGSNIRLYDPETNGTIFTDSIGNDLTNFEYGFYVESKNQINKQLEVTLSGRVDKNENFNLVSSQRVSLIRQISNSQFIRGAIQTGRRIPNIREQYINQDLGDIQLVGGLTDVVDAYELQGNAFFINSLDKFIETVQDEANNDIRFGKEGPIDVSALRKENIDILRNGIIEQDRFRGIKPEQITSIEFGYKGLIEGKRLFEIVYYLNYYNNFIGTSRVIKPRTSPTEDLQLAMQQVLSPSSSNLFFVTDNARKDIITQGLELVYDVTSDQGTNLAINMTFASIISNNDDPLTPGFNTPPFKFNMKLGNNRLGRFFGAQLTWRFRSAFEWESSFADGTVPDYHTLDFQLTYRIPSIKSSVRIGGNNVLNHEQFNSFGSPEISSYYYLLFSYGL
ncbi:TonB-dependent receptor [Roseivirga sp.]|uniref:TonB-dependent receptor n=1 Tax=Roseivirga sp. TaxID=1964215 RepID=UPI003B8C3E22